MGFQKAENWRIMPKIREKGDGMKTSLFQTRVLSQILALGFAIESRNRPSMGWQGILRTNPSSNALRILPIAKRPLNMVHPLRRFAQNQPRGV